MSKLLIRLKLNIILLYIIVGSDRRIKVTGQPAFTNLATDTFEYNRHFYRYYNDGEGLKFDDAKFQCERHGGNLILIDGGGESSTLRNFLSRIDRIQANDRGDNWKVWIGNQWQLVPDTCRSNGICDYNLTVHSGDNEAAIVTHFDQFDTATVNFAYSPPREAYQLQILEATLTFVCEYDDACNTEALSCPLGTECTTDDQYNFECNCNDDGEVDYVSPEYLYYCFPPEFENETPNHYGGTPEQPHYYVYYSNADGATWAEAGAICRRDYGYLATLNTPAELQFVQTLAATESTEGSSDAWVGADWEGECGLSTEIYDNACRHEAFWVKGTPRNVFDNHENAQFLGFPPPFHYLFRHSDGSLNEKPSNSLHSFI